MIDHPALMMDVRTLPPRQRRRVRPWHLAIVWALCMSPLAWWGLPSRAHDDTLFGGPAWVGERIRQGESNKQAVGADVDPDPLQNRERVIDLTADEKTRATILIRYRVYSHQPDEMITFRAIQKFRPRQFKFDPEMYQYGGAYVYLVAAAIGAASLTGFTHITSDLNFYLDQPEQFGRFYVVARLISLAFAAAALAGVARLGRMTGVRGVSWLAMISLAFSPVFVSGALEAKPHLPSAAMLLWATVFALRYRADTRVADAVWMGVFGGAAASLVLTGFAAALLWPAIWLAVRQRARERATRGLLLGGAFAVAVYVLSNPYVFYNALMRPEALRRNIGNSTAMYEVARVGEGALRVAELMGESVGVIVPVLGGLVLLVLLATRTRETVAASSVAIALTLLCIAIGAGKPAEFARFLLYPAAMLTVAAAFAAMSIWRKWDVAGLFMAICVAVPFTGVLYVHAFAMDALTTSGSRATAARLLREQIADGDRIAVVQEPAPYSIPPLDFAHRTVLLLPAKRPANFSIEELPEWLILTADHDDDTRRYGDWWREHYKPGWITGNFKSQFATEITWANKPVFVYRKRATRAE